MNYAQLLESSGTQHIDTGFVPNQNTRVVCKAFCPTSTKANFLFGARTSASSNQFMFAGSSDNCYTSGYGSAAKKFSAAYNNGRGMVVDKNKAVTTLTLPDGTTASVTGAEATFTAPCSMVLFGCNSNGKVTGGTAQIYYCQIYDNDVLVRDFWPCWDQDGVLCLYDKVGKKYYYNAGTGEFKGGGVSDSGGGGEAGGTISFTINGTVYTADSGMTWAQWVASSCNTAGIEMNGSEVYSPSTDGFVAYNDGRGTVGPSDKIISGYNYWLI